MYIIYRDLITASKRTDLPQDVILQLEEAVHEAREAERLARIARSRRRTERYERLKARIARTLGLSAKPE